MRSLRVAAHQALRACSSASSGVIESMAISGNINIKDSKMASLRTSSRTQGWRRSREAHQAVGGLQEACLFAHYLFAAA